MSSVIPFEFEKSLGLFYTQAARAATYALALRDLPRVIERDADTRSDAWFESSRQRRNDIEFFLFKVNVNKF